MTVTVNPAIDLTVYTDSLQIGEINAVESMRKDSGGKGINVSKVLKNLDVLTVATGFLAGEAGCWIRDELKNKSISHDFLETSGETRTNVKIIASDVETQLNGSGPELTETDINRLIEKLNDLLQDGDGLILAGSLPKQTDPGMYRQIIQSLKNQVFVAVDTSGAALAETIEARPHFLKPNEEELNQLFDTALETETEIIDAAYKLREKGVEIVLISRGEKGSIMVSAAGTCKAIPPVITPVSTIGAGDSTVAGFVSKYLQTKDLIRSLRFANACGVATTLKPGSQVCSRIEVENMLDQIQLDCER
ncbi:1-phosphofructokinase [Fodinisporobacter ferrooxydans]|uniref:Tagatose-6-phosphate kinase n=1 Tax=Fodinisporobacter ferrooxydans TaxID=2901836 RepID=A0ABY4CY56_9BACL|nr:1-phosphofructokinase [Alicyclobacillaceae bacterium MYW30-H2]